MTSALTQAAAKEEAVELDARERRFASTATSPTAGDRQARGRRRTRRSGRARRQPGAARSPRAGRRARTGTEGCRRRRRRRPGRRTARGRARGRDRGDGGDHARWARACSAVPARATQHGHPITTTTRPPTRFEPRVERVRDDPLREQERHEAEREYADRVRHRDDRAEQAAARACRAGRPGTRRRSSCRARA